MLKKTKQYLLKTLKSTGLLEFLANTNWRKDKLLILAYHGVSIHDEHLWNSSLFMPQDLLRQRFELIRRHNCNVLPLDEACNRLYERSLPERAVAITFDDGLYDFYLKAVPIMTEFNFPATLYLTSFYSQYNRPVFGVAVDYLLWKAREQFLSMDSLVGIKEQIYLGHAGERSRAHSVISAHAIERNLSAVQKDDLLRKLCDNVGIDYDEFCEQRFFQLMNSNEVEAISKVGVDVQLHTHRHRVPLNEELFKREIEDNRRVIEDATQKTTNHFCYPSGEHHPKFLPWLKAAGVTYATTCDTDLSTPETNPLLLPRLVDTCSLSEVEFEGWLTGASHFLPQRRA